MGLMGDLFRDFEAILNAGLGASEHSPDSALSYRYVPLHYSLPIAFFRFIHMFQLPGSASTSISTINC